MEIKDKITFNKILTAVVEYKASDLHLLVGSPPILRIDNELRPLAKEPSMTRGFLEGAVFSFLSQEQQERLVRDKTLTFSNNFGPGLRFRVNIFYQKGNIGASFKFIPGTIKSLKELGLPLTVEEFIKAEKGLLIVTGPFGSGKTATVAALIEAINTEGSKYIVVLEEPIEYIFTNKKSVIEQREVGRDVPSLATGLDFLKGEDVDVIALPNLGEAEVIYKALTLVEAGHLIIAQMNSNAVYQVIERLDNLFPEDRKDLIRSMLGENLIGVISQRLLPRIGGGQILVSEILKANVAVRASIKEGKFYQINSILQTSQAEGMVSLDHSLAELVKTGEVSLEDALSQAVDPVSLRSMVL